MIVKGVIVHNRKVIDPRKFLVDQLGAEKVLVDAIDRTNGSNFESVLIERFEALDDAKKRSAASRDDETQA